MSDLMQCPACGGKVSTQAKACPHCGHPVPTSTPDKAKTGDTKAEMTGGLIGLVLFLAFIAWMGYQQLKPSAAKQSRSTDGSIIMEKTQIGCMDMDDYLRLKQVGASGDKEAYLKMQSSMIGLGRCVIIPEGSVVYREKDNLKNRVVRVRKKGETSTWWTNWVYQQ